MIIVIEKWHKFSLEHPDKLYSSGDHLFCITDLNFYSSFKSNSIFVTLATVIPPFCAVIKFCTLRRMNILIVYINKVRRNDKFIVLINK